MQRNLKSLIAVILLFSFGCAKFDNNYSGDKAAPTVDSTNTVEKVTSENLSDYVHIEVQPTTKAERYMVFFGWPQLNDPKKIRIRMEQTLAVVDPSQTTFSHEVNHDQTLTYTFDVLSSDSKIMKSFSKQVVVPKDFVVRVGQSEFTEDQKLSVKRVFLYSDVPLRTNGFNIEITTDDLIVTKGLIETLPEGSKAPQGSDGRSAGEVYIRAKTAVGELKVTMRGQIGGDGLKGDPYSSRAADGSPPGSGTQECSCVRCPILQPSNLPLESPDKLQPMYCTCDSYGSDGTNGSAGAKGRIGGRAGNGGDAGNLKIEITDGSAFQIQTNAIAGVPGQPGEGGDGQPGGIAPGTKNKCGGNLGSNGPTGPKGDAGAVGLNGKQGLVCIYIASEGKNDCY